MIITERVEHNKRGKIEHNIQTYKSFLDYWNNDCKRCDDDWKDIPETIKDWLDEVLDTDTIISKRNLIRVEIRSRLLPNSRMKTQRTYWLNKGYNEEDAIEEVRKIQSLNAGKLKIAKEKNPEKYKGILPTQLEYWLKHTDGDGVEAKRLLKDRQTTFSREICISKYGKVKGEKIFNERQKNWSIKLKKLYKEGRFSTKPINPNNQRYSSNSIELFDKLNEDFGSAEYGPGEKMISVTGNTKKLFPDFIINNRIIEYNGDYWHANPKVYLASDTMNYPSGNIKAVDVWKRDKNKIKKLKKLGYKVLVIWESDYLKDKNKIINKCIEFLKNEKVYK